MTKAETEVGGGADLRKTMKTSLLLSSQGFIFTPPKVTSTEKGT